MALSSLCSHTACGKIHFPHLWCLIIYSDAGKDWRQEEEGTTEDEMVGWHHQLDGHEFEKAPGVGDGRGSLACCSPWGCRVGHDWATELIEHLSPSGSNFCEGRCHFAIWTTSPSPTLVEFLQNRHSVSIVSKNQAYPKRFGIIHNIQKNEQQVLNIISGCHRLPQTLF